MRKNSNKNSFVFYHSYEEQIKMLNGDEVKELVLAMINYDRDGETPKFNGILQMAFSFIKTNLDIDLEKYEKICERNKKNGLKGGRPKNPKNPSGNFGKPKKPKKADNDNDNDIDIDNDNEVLDIYKYIELNFGRLLSPIEYEEVQGWDDNELTKYAIKQAVLNGKCNIKYISRILESYQKNSITTIQQAQVSEENFKNQNNKQKVECVPDWFDKDIEPEYDEEKTRLLNDMLRGT